MSTVTSANAAQSTGTTGARTLRQWVAGADHEGSSDRFADVTNPATGEVAARLALASPADVEAAIGAAKAAFPRWRDTSLARRSQVLFRFRELVNAPAEELPELITAEHGKGRGLDPPVARPGGEHQPVRLPGDGGNVVLPDRDRRREHRGAQAEREGALGGAVAGPVVGRGGPAGGRVQRAQRGQGRRGRCAHRAYETATAHGKRVQALGGAKNHMVVLPDAELDLAAGQAVNAAYGFAGKRCMAIPAVVAVGGIADDLVDRIAKRTVTNDGGAARRFQNEIEVGMTGVHVFTWGKVVTSRWLDPSHSPFPPQLHYPTNH